MAKQPTVADYPVLSSWLSKHNARELWCSDNAHASTQAWRINGHLVLIVLYVVAPGWDIFTSHGSVKIEDSFVDAENRIGLKT